MKLYELFNMIGNGENFPKKIKYQGDIYEYDEQNKIFYNKEENMELMEFVHEYDLRENIEIIEEPKKIEKIKTVGCNVAIPSLNNELVGTDTPLALELVICKLNEIIDIIEKGDNNE